MVKLADLFRSIDMNPIPGSEDILVQGIEFDSRRVKPGSVFVAFDGVNRDGHRFITDAIERGAIAVVGTLPAREFSVPYISVVDSRLILAKLSAAYFDFPASKMIVIGVTGTDGKTTTCNLLYQMLRLAGCKVGMISTVNAIIGDKILDTGFHVTTPDAPDVQHYLAMMVEEGITHVILETTSHGLAQQRVEACEFDVGVVTNITHEHLDYHGTYEAYRSSKARLLTYLAETKQKPQMETRLAVINRDDSSFEYLKGIITVPVISYGTGPEADVRAENITSSVRNLSFDIVTGSVRFRVESPLLGEYNVSNILAAASAGKYGLGLTEEIIQKGIASMTGIPGRMESIEMGQDFIAIIDFAHTPNALLNALKSARPLTRGRVIAVFGSAGLRDRAKRRMMAEVSAEYADITILTAEDPRTESLKQILAEMADGVIAKGGIETESFWRIPDRRDAVRFAVRMAITGDTVIVCGKGHEQSMCFGETEYLWDDRIAMRAALAELLSVKSPEMPFLPDVSYDEI
ncbi:MAG: UDP-N-acetylmuramoyl-L-alanyl-D-glutamate--2,6-diaminopimelate ligase [Chloroflexota bacterium]